MFWTPKPGGTSVAFVGGTTPLAKPSQTPLTLYAMVSNSFHHPIISFPLLICYFNTSVRGIWKKRANINKLGRQRTWTLVILSFTGYNEVVRIPSGATNIDVRQHSYSGKSDDDNYLGRITARGQNLWCMMQIASQCTTVDVLIQSLLWLKPRWAEIIEHFRTFYN